MTWTSPFTAVTGAVITAAGWNTSARDNLNHLRAFIPDPASASLVPVSAGTSSAAWGQVPTAAIADGAVTNPKLAGNAVSTANVINNSLTAVKLHAIDAPSNDEVYTYDTATGFAEWQTVAQLTTTTPLAAASLAAESVTEAKLDAMDSPADDEVLTYNSSNGRLEWQGVSALANSVPSGLIAAFATAAAIAAGWSRYSAADGRVLVGAGTTFSVTYTENADYGSSWSHTHTDAGHPHGAAALGVSGNTSTPSATEEGGSGADIVPADGHTHNQGSLDVTGATDSGTALISSDGWVIPSRAIVWAQKS